MAEFIRLEPAYVKKIWGGTWLAEPDETGGRVGEAWTLSARDDHPSFVATGPYTGVDFPTYLRSVGPNAAGTNATVMDAFPTLIKFLDADQPLSIQVHPDDTYARAHGMPYGKQEMWVIIAAHPGAFLYLGLREAMTPENFALAVADGSIEGMLNEVPVHAGDVFNIHAGLLHAIGGGVLLAEVQQNSDTTYRVWDFGRIGADGKPRELHVRQASEVASLKPPSGVGPLGTPESIPGGTRQLLGEGACFHTERWIITDRTRLSVTPESFMALVVLDGSATLSLDAQHEPISAGETWFVPAQDATLLLAPTWDGCTFLCVTIPTSA